MKADNMSIPECKAIAKEMLKDELVESLSTINIKLCKKFIDSEITAYDYINTLKYVNMYVASMAKRVDIKLD